MSIIRSRRIRLQAMFQLGITLRQGLGTAAVSEVEAS